MPSKSLVGWQTVRSASLDEIEAAHRAIGGHGRGRRFATLQLNHAYAVLVASQFQGFCRDLHSEAADFLGNAVQPAALRPLAVQLFTTSRQLDYQNAQPGSIGADFGRFFMPKFWDEVDSLNPRSLGRRQELADLNRWRNAIAHQDFAEVGGASLRLAQVRSWRRTCGSLARTFDRVLGARLRVLVGHPPW